MTTTFPTLPYLFPLLTIFIVKLRRALTILPAGPDSLLSNSLVGPYSLYCQITPGPTLHKCNVFRGGGVPTDLVQKRYLCDRGFQLTF